MKLKTSCFCFLVLIIHLISAQELPPIEVYTPKQYGAENQNWSISQSEENHIYVGNNKGLLEYNGARWTLYPSPNETIIRSVFAKDDTVYSGCYMEFGYWKKNEVGELEYTSLSQKLTSPLIDDEQFWKIFSLDKWVLFQSLNRIYIYNTQDKSFNVIDSEIAITKMYLVDDKVYFQSVGRGLFQIDNGQKVMVSNHLVLRDRNIINIFRQGDHLLIETMQDGFYILDGSRINKWDIPANELLEGLSVYCSMELKDGSFALGTISKGLIHLTAEGEANYEINQAKGLSNNTVLSMYEDNDRNIWLGLDNGINCVNITSPYSIYNDDKGTLGTVYASKVFKGNLYLGTNQGLFVKPIKSDGNFEFISGTNGQVWCLVEHYGTLFCGHNLGTFTVEGNQANLFSNVDGTWDIKKIADSNLLLQGNYNGLNVIEKLNGTWKLRNRIEGFQNSSKYFELLNDSTVFVSHEYKGVFRINLDAKYTIAKSVYQDSIMKGLNSSIVKYKGDILYAFRDGIYTYDETSLNFKKDSTIGELFISDQYTSGKLVNTQDGVLWGFSDKNISYLSQGKLSDKLEVNRIAYPASLRKGMTGYENMSHLYDRSYLFGSSSGYTIINLDAILERTYDITFNDIGNFRLNEYPKLVNSIETGYFQNRSNNIQFSYSIPDFDKFQEPEFQYQMEGLFQGWSNWSTESSQLFKNLSHGDYTFTVRGRVGNQLTRNVVTYSFTIAKPWYLSIWAVLGYFIFFLILVIIMHYFYNRHYKLKQDKLIVDAEREMELKELENSQQVMQLKNEKLEQDVDNKNRELAISTMSLIKKNEFLNTIKNELKLSKDDKHVKSVIRIIDKNLNNSDDWNFFEEAFNNADKDFLKKIKDKHASLTPNDLKLCAYLRLNLSSKEIAPLLNISTKSVEVKRYRLRKKMELEHDASLTNYILEI